MRSVIWERKPKIAPPHRSEAAERIRAGMRRGPITRITDPIVEWIEGATARFEAVDRRVTKFAGRYAAVAAAGIFTIAFFVAGRREMAPLFFGAFAASALLAMMLNRWQKGHPLPPVHERTARHEVKAIAMAIVGGIIVVVLSMALTVSFDDHYNGVESLYHGAIGAIGLYGFRTIEDRQKDESGVLAIAIGWTVMAVLVSAAILFT